MKKQKVIELAVKVVGSSRAYGIPDGTGHHLVHGSRPFLVG